MPTYAYRCKSCQHEFEELQGISEPPLTRCPVCHKDTLVRMISGGAGLVFKGSGFYGTDYKKSTPKPPPDKKHSSKEPKKESKPESSGGPPDQANAGKKPTGGDSNSSGGDPPSST